MDCKGAVEDWDDPDEEVVVPVAPISAGSTALMLMLIGCTGSLVVDDDAGMREFFAGSVVRCKGLALSTELSTQTDGQH